MRNWGCQFLVKSSAGYVIHAQKFLKFNDIIHLERFRTIDTLTCWSSTIKSREFISHSGPLAKGFGRGTNNAAIGSELFIFGTECTGFELEGENTNTINQNEKVLNIMISKCAIIVHKAFRTFTILQNCCHVARFGIRHQTPHRTMQLPHLPNQSLADYVPSVKGWFWCTNKVAKAIIPPEFH